MNDYGDINNSYPNYGDDKEKCTGFVRDFVSHTEDGPAHKYMEILQGVANRETTTIDIELDDVMAHQGDEDLVYRISTNTQRFAKLFSEVFDELMPVPDRDISEKQDIWDILRSQRMARVEDNGDGAENAGDPNEGFPAALMRRYEVNIIPTTDLKPTSLRNVKAGNIGSLTRIKGMVTRVSDVKPLMGVATYTCDQCGFEVYQEVFSRDFTPLDKCPSRMCVTNQVQGKLYLQTRGSKFEKFQEVKVQELPDQVPVGHIPRSMTIQCRGGNTRLVSPGDVVTVCGVFLPQRYQGFQALKAGLIADTFLLAQAVTKHKKSYAELMEEADRDQATSRRLVEVFDSDDAYGRLARSIAPEIYGHEDVKKALLLMLVGGVTRELPDGMRIRGDVNVLLMGDPGVAKSQLLKYIAGAAPRGVYTTGKGSSGVGLTAAVARDPATGDLSLEGGALVLADRGVCCIDEFDKMDEYDRTAIHEVMEQQTVSIAKAGITATLNARTTVLAAANPLYGRYNTKLPMSANINLPNSLLSRFDLVFLLVDRADPQLDAALARHVAHVHATRRAPALDFDPYPPALIKAYIAQARDFAPVVPPALAGYLVEAYVGLRQRDQSAAGKGGHNDQTTMTARQLLSILRMAQALARLQFQEEVARADVDEALRLTQASTASLDEPGARAGAGGGGSEDAVSRIYAAVLQLKDQTGTSELSYEEVAARVTRLGYGPEQLDKALREYAELQVLQVDDARTTISVLG